MSIAARTSAFGKRWLPGQTGISVPAALIGSGPVADPTGPIGLTVEIFVNSAWTDITPFVYYRGDVGVTITRGSPDETSQVPPQTARMIINNRDGRFSPRNPLGPYYGQISRNTPMRVSRLQNGIRRYRFYGEVPAWPTTWDISGTDVIATVTATGLLRRLSQGNKPIGSAMYRAYAISPPSTLIAYWPCEDGAIATVLASGLAGGAPMTVSGTPTPASSTAFICSDPLPLLSGSTWAGTIPPYTPPSTGFLVGNVLRFLLAVPSTGAVDTAVIARMYTAGTIARVDLLYGATGQLQLIGYSSGGAQLFASGYTAFGITGQKIRVDIQLRTNGTSVDWFLGVGLTLGPVLVAGTVAVASVGNATQVLINPDGRITDTALGHISYQSNWQFLVDDLLALFAWLGEPPAAGTNTVPQSNAVDTARFTRLCREQNVPGVVRTSVNGYDSDQVNSSGVVWNGFGANPLAVSMGYQLSATFPALIGEVVTTDLGLLFEATDQMSLVIRTRLSLCNQAAHLTLDYAQNGLSDAPAPVDDDRFTRNDVTATRIGGSSYRQVLASGTLSTQPPPLGVGEYDTAGVPISLGADTLLPDAAGWRLHMGTVDEARYPQISINLRYSTFTSSVALMNAALTIDIGDRLVVANPPAWLPPDAISQIVLGYTETMGVFEHDMVFNGSPESPYRIAVLEDTVLGHADTDGSTLALPAGAADATISVATTGAATGSPLWTTSAGDFPFDVVAGGERMTVTGITGASSPQLFSVTRSVNGVVKGQTVGTDVRLAQPMILSL